MQACEQGYCLFDWRWARGHDQIASPIFEYKENASIKWKWK